MTETVVRTLIENPLLLLVVVLAVGYPLGKLRIGHTSLGVAAVLFSGLVVGALHPDFKLPELVYQLGLVLFVYTIGLANGAAFFASFRRKGLRDNLLILAVLLAATAGAFGAGRALGLSGTLTSGMFAGGLTNTPALAAVLESVKATSPGSTLDARLAEPVVAYSVTYPVGVLGVIVAIALFQRLARRTREVPADGNGESRARSQALVNRAILITRPAPGQSVARLVKARGWRVAFARLKREGELSVVTGATELASGDRVSVVGPPEEVARVVHELGEPSEERLELHAGGIDYRRVFVSNPRVTGYRLRDLQLIEQFGAILTRVRRGDTTFVPDSETVLEPGDRVRVVGQRKDLDAVQVLLGDSYRASSEVDVLSFALGLGLGLLVGLATLPVGGVTLRLGLAGGPLVVALFLGARGRTGPLVWTLPFGANLTLRQLGLILFLAGVGTRAGWAFVSTLKEGNGLGLFITGAAITCLTATATLLVGHYLFRIPIAVLSGMVAGHQTQPAVLAFADEQARNELPHVGYATVYPVAFVAKILLAQVLLATGL